MTRTEDTLVERMAQNQWLRRRAELFESKCLEPATSAKNVWLFSALAHQPRTRLPQGRQRVAKAKSRKAQGGVG
jgi:hypothetical protein